MSDYWAACFDLDGTLIDTEPVHLRAETSCLITLGIDTGMKSLAETYELDYELVMATYMPLWESGLRSDLTVLPGTRDILSWLKEHRVDGAGDIR